MKMILGKSKGGFTILEILLTLAIIALLAGLGVPVYQSFQNRNNLDIATSSIVQSLRRAQVLSQAIEGDSSWGVDVRSGGVTLYKGTSYASREAVYDELFDMPVSITPSGTGEISYSRLTGAPLSTGTITLTSAQGEVRNMTINEKGTITY